MTIYNLLVLAGRKLGTNDLIQRVDKMHSEAEPKQVGEALQELVKRKLVVEAEGFYNLVDTKRRPVRTRLRLKDGDGWEGWMVQDPRAGMMSLESALGDHA